MSWGRGRDGTGTAARGCQVGMSIGGGPIVPPVALDMHQGRLWSVQLQFSY